MIRAAKAIRKGGGGSLFWSKYTYNIVITGCKIGENLYDVPH